MYKINKLYGRRRLIPVEEHISTLNLTVFKLG